MDQLITTGAEVSLIVPQIWSSRWYDVLLADLPFSSLISKDYEGEIQAIGDRVKISTMPEFEDGEILAEGDRADAEALTVSQQELVINQRVVKDFAVSNKASLQSISFVDKLKDMAVYAIKKKVEKLIISLIVPNAAAPDHSIAYGSGTTLALSDILNAKELLDAQNVPMANREAVLGSAQLNDVFNITGFTSSDFVASGSPLASGQLPAQLLGFKPNFTTLVGNTSYWFHTSFMTMAAQQGLQVKEYDLGVDGLRASRVNTDTLIGIKQLDGLRVISIS
jgi:hypothetical protein